MTVKIYKAKEIDKMRKVGKLAANLLDHLEGMVKPGVSTLELDDEAERWTQSHGAVSAPLNYMGTYPKSICTSVNNVICHGIPSGECILKEGDIINIDVTPKLDGWHGDTSRTIMVGDVSDEAKKLVKVTKECLNIGIAQAIAGNKLNDIGKAIDAHAVANGLSSVKDFVGHGIGQEFHREPFVYHYDTSNNLDLTLVEGMIFTIEPMLNEGTEKWQMLSDNWAAVTADGGLSAQFEHTIVVRSGQAEILTKND